MAYPTMTALPEPPQRTNTPNVFSERADAFLGSLPSFGSEANAIAKFINEAVQQVSNAADSASVALAASNYKGHWSSLSGALTIPASVWHDGGFWLLEEDLDDVADSEPATENSNWAALNGGQLLSLRRYDLDYVETSGALDLSRGQVFRMNALGNSAITVSINNAPRMDRAITVVITIEGNNASVTWPGSVRWDQGTAPALASGHTVITLINDGSGGWLGSVGFRRNS